MRALSLPVLLLLLVVGGCSGDAAETPDDEQVLPAHCNPLSLDHCMLPWPSSFYLAADPATATGFRVRYPPAAMPVNDEGQPVDPAPYNALDGFSAASQPLVFFAEGISPEGLPGQRDLAASVGDDSPIWLLEFDTGARVPLFAEIDAHPDEGEPAALIIRPQRRLRFDTRHVVVLRQGLKDASGQPLRSPPPFARVRDGRPSKSEALRAEAQRLEPVLAWLRGQDIDPDELVLAWDFHTASAQAVTGPLVAMVDDALARLSTPPSYEALEVEPQAADEPDLLWAVEGKISVPSYLQSDDPDAWLQRDARGLPTHRGPQSFDFWINVPRCAEQAAGPLPVLLFGHGLLVSPKQAFAERLHRRLAQRLCMIEVGTRWIGLSDIDITAVASLVIPDFSNLPRITDRLHQAQVNAHALAELVRGSIWNDPTLRLDGRPLSDGRQLYYLGISQGGIQGVTFAALNQRIERYVYNVGGGWWSMMIERSSNFAPLLLLLETSYADPLDRLLLVVLSQSLWDGTDPINFAPHVLEAPLPGRSAKRVLYQEAIDDDQVPNIATRTVVRGLGLPLLAPASESVHGVPEAAAPQDSAYVQWDTDPPVEPPEANLPAPKPPRDESAHFAVRHLESFNLQLEAFLRPDGEVIHPCEGPCGAQ